MIFLIPCRAGSKRLPGKNKRLFCGKPLWMWSYETAKRLAKKGDHVVVSTDDDDILASGVAEERAKVLCQDDSTMTSLVSSLFWLGDVCLLQPTSPTRTDALVRMMLARGDTCRTVTDGKPNGQCYVYRYRDSGPLASYFPKFIDVETEQGHDIDRLDQFNEAEQWMTERLTAPSPAPSCPSPASSLPAAPSAAPASGDPASAGTG